MKNEELKPCPFCGYEKPKLMFREADFLGKNDFGDKKSKYVFYVRCNKCHSRSKPIKSDYIVNANPWSYVWHKKYENPSDIEKYGVWADKAIEEWNRRIEK